MQELLVSVAGQRMMDRMGSENITGLKTTYSYTNKYRIIFN